MKIEPALLDQCRRMAFAIAPELQRQPFYLLDASDLDVSVVRATGGVLGFACTNQLSQLGIRDAITDWSGWGPAVVLNGTTISDAAFDGHFERCVLSVMVHELAHVVPVTPPVIADFEPDVQHIETQRAKMTESLGAPTFEPGSTEDKDQHDVKFYRRAVHLLVRANAAGFDPCHDGLLPSCSRTAHYLPLLLREALAMQAAEFACIDETPPPPGLQEQFELDRQHFRNYQQLLNGNLNHAQNSNHAVDLRPPITPSRDSLRAC